MNGILSTTGRCAAVYTLFLALTGSAWCAPALGIEEVTQGTLLFKTPTPGRYEAAPTQHTDATIRVTGPLARATVTQTFRNPGDTWQEAVYAFPLPEDAAVDRLQMQVGERLIEGVIREREQARREYEAARDSGRNSALVEQHRPNLFTTAVANIPPGGEIRVQIQYQQPVIWRDGRFTLRFPMGVTPRYSPAIASTLAERLQVDGGWAILPGEIANSVPLPNTADAPAAPGNRVTLALTLDAGLPLQALESPSHPIDSAADPGGATTVSLRDGTVPADRDFVLHWTPAAGSEPRAAFFTESNPTGEYGLLMVVPPKVAAATTAGREILFVVDTSGSMGGASIRQARAALATAVQRLQPGQRFNLLQFNSSTAALFDAARPATAQHKAQALRYIADLEATGGTEMLPALRTAMALTENDHGLLQQILFITDGAVANESELLSFLHARLGQRRLFTVGIGAAPNGHFMTEAAHFGRGTYTYIATPEQVQQEMDRLFEKLEHPMLTNAALQLPTGADRVPDPLPDLYSGEPLVAVMKLDAPIDRAQVAGHLGSTAWTQDLDLRQTAAQSGIGVLWAREKIRYWTRQQARGVDAGQVRRAITDLGLTHHLVSRHTSLVAVDVTPVRPPDATAGSHPIQGNTPAGFEATTAAPIPGADLTLAMAQGATPSLLYLISGLLLLLTAGMLWRLAPGPQGRPL